MSYVSRFSTTCILFVRMNTRVIGRNCGLGESFNITYLDISPVLSYWFMLPAHKLLYVVSSVMASLSSFLDIGSPRVLNAILSIEVALHCISLSEEG
jgi:hypothetical protein